ncbi:hypothetical protein L9F63_022928, partial [Diploptera punctata]
KHVEDSLKLLNLQRFNPIGHKLAAFNSLTHRLDGADIDIQVNKSTLILRKTVKHNNNSKQQKILENKLLKLEKNKHFEMI